MIAQYLLLASMTGWTATQAKRSSSGLDEELTDSSHGALAAATLEAAKMEG